MKNPKIPVFNIDQFGHHGHEQFYANSIPLHLKHHHFINTPHKHDFYLTMIFTRGGGVHEIDFVKYKVKPGSMFVMFPGQTHSWKLSDDIDGYIFFHTKEFFDLHFASLKLSDYPFFYSTEGLSLFQLKDKGIKAVTNLFENIWKEHKNNRILKDHKLRSLINSLYIDLARMREFANKEHSSSVYLAKLRDFENLLEQNFVTVKLPAVYAEMLHLSERHLNRICKACLDKTTTDVILDRIVLEAKRQLVNTDQTVSQIAANLGYPDNSYFTRLFKKRTGETPLAFVKRNKAG